MSIYSSTALIALIISFVTLTIYSNTYNLSEEQFLLNTTENLAISVGGSNVSIVDLKSNKEEPELYYRDELSICIVNKSNLPISIINASASRSDYGNDVRLFPTIHELDFPISMQPQETKFLDCYMQIKIPDFINDYIIEKFPEPSDVDFDTITKYLFFEKKTDLIGNKVIVEMKGDATYFKQHLTLPFSLRLGTSKGNNFSTQFYRGGSEFFLDKEYMDKLTEQYGSWGIEYSTEPIVDESGKYHVSIWQFIKDYPSTLLFIIIPTAIFAFVQVGFQYFLEKQKVKWTTSMTQDEEVDIHTEQSDSPTEDNPD